MQSERLSIHIPGMVKENTGKQGLHSSHAILGPKPRAPQRCLDIGIHVWRFSTGPRLGKKAPPRADGRRVHVSFSVPLPDVTPTSDGLA